MTTKVSSELFAIQMKYNDVFDGPTSEPKPSNRCWKRLEWVKGEWR